MKKQEEIMLQIQDTLISLDIIEKKFFCDLKACKGICCVEGDSGAPLSDEEVSIIEDEYENVKPFMRKEGIAEVERQGAWVIDIENDKVTPLVNNNECAFVIYEDGIAFCAIEKAFFEGKTSFRKPVSCHLYPVRVKEYKDFTAVNYDCWDICKSAILLGSKKGVPVYKFTKEALIRRFGKDWYKELELAVEALDNDKKKHI